MGICLDTEANTATQNPDDDPVEEWKGGGTRSANLRTPSNGNFPMQNLGKVKFDPPKVPVVFILGGPGSGKVTHCDTLMQEKRGVTHINMMDLLQQYAMGNDMQDFSQLSSKTVTEVLMLEMKMAPAAKAYLVSGYPRSMRDVVEYSEKIQVVNGVILISWRQAVLQKQIDYGAKLGHVVLSLAKMELDNFFKNVMPVADYFDQSDMLMAVNGERAPSEVYKDFRTAVLDILGAQDNQEALLNGVAGMGRGVDEIPGSIVSVDTAPSQNKVITVTSDQYQSPTKQIQEVNTLMGQNVRVNSQSNQQSFDNKTLPPIIWVIGGPGSNKATLCLKAVTFNPGWGHLSIGRLLRTLAESDPKPRTENYAVKEAISGGEMVPEISIDKLLEKQIMQMNDKKGIIIDGYPRDVTQIRQFEAKYKQMPPIILLDCSKLQLGRGRLDDTVSSFRRRLELFRELTLPMLKEMDTEGRLTIVDGDTDSPSVQREFERVIRQQIQGFSGKVQPNISSTSSSNGRLGNISNIVKNDTIVQDLEEVSRVIPTISHHVSLTNGHLRPHGNSTQNNANHNLNNNNINYINNNNHINSNSVSNHNNNNNNNYSSHSNNNGTAKIGQNGHIANGRPSFRNMLEEAENYPIDSHI